MLGYKKNAILLRMLVLVMGYTLSANASAVELNSWSLTTDLRYGYGLEQHETVQTQIELTPRVELGLGNSALVLEGRLRFDEQRRLSRTDEFESDLNTYSSGDRPAQLGGGARVELRDAYYEFSSGNHLFRIGKQQIVWGALDGLKVADVLNPQSFREFILDDFGHSRIPLWSALADLSFGDWRAEIAWVPQTSTHELPGPLDQFALTAARFNLGSALDQNDPVALAAVSDIRTESPENRLNRGGLRLGRRVGNFDLNFVAARTLDYEPLASIQPIGGQPRLVREYFSSTFYGLSAETAVGPLALRAEAGWWPNKYFNTLSESMPGSVSLPDRESYDQLTIAVAVDFNAPAGIFANFQLLHDEVRGADNQLVRPERDTIATVFFRRQFRYDTITVDLRWYGTLDEQDGLGRLKIHYDLNDNTQIALSVDQFYGDSNGLFGQFSKADRIIFSLTHTL